LKKLFELKQVDTECYENSIRDFIPDKIIDIHTHVYTRELLKEDEKSDGRVASWPERVASENPIEDLIDTYHLMFPGKAVIPLIFTTPVKLKDLDKANDLISNICSTNQAYGLILDTPEWSSDELERKLLNGNFHGVKVYLNFAPAYIPGKEIRIFDFLPHHHLSVLNRHGKIVMLHIPRDGRLKDPVNLAQIIEIEKHYPDIKLIIAHVGRAYCPEDVGNAFETLSVTKNVMFDFSANTNLWVFEQLINAVGPKRILFGSDLPITRMRMKRICENGQYVNIVPEGLYGDVSNDKNMREISGKEAGQLTFFMYEEISAFRHAAIATGLSESDIQDVFYNNALQILNKT
jgi:uncharacterized protein